MRSRVLLPHVFCPHHASTSTRTRQRSFRPPRPDICLGGSRSSSWRNVKRRPLLVARCRLHLDSSFTGRIHLTRSICTRPFFHVCPRCAASQRSRCTNNVCLVHNRATKERKAKEASRAVLMPRHTCARATSVQPCARAIRWAVSALGPPCA